MSSIRMMPQNSFKAGVCCVCAAPAVLKWQDTEVGLVGDCCSKDLIRADEVLKLAYKYAGVVRPTTEAR